MAAILKLTDDAIRHCLDFIEPDDIVSMVLSSRRIHAVADKRLRIHRTKIRSLAVICSTWECRYLQRCSHGHTTVERFLKEVVDDPAAMQYVKCLFGTGGSDLTDETQPVFCQLPTIAVQNILLANKKLDSTFHDAYERKPSGLAPKASLACLSRNINLIVCNTEWEQVYMLRLRMRTLVAARKAQRKGCSVLLPAARGDSAQSNSKALPGVPSFPLCEPQVRKLTLVFYGNTIPLRQYMTGSVPGSLTLCALIPPETNWWYFSGMTSSIHGLMGRGSTIETFEIYEDPSLRDGPAGWEQTSVKCILAGIDFPSLFRWSSSLQSVIISGEICSYASLLDSKLSHKVFRKALRKQKFDVRVEQFGQGDQMRHVVTRDSR
jgi:hypothetical protein